MRHVFAFLLLFGFACLAEETRLLPSPLTMEQQMAEREFSQRAVAEGWTFTYDVSLIGEFATGYEGPGEITSIESLGTDERLKSFNLRTDSGIGLSPMLSQGSCGSCVVFSVISNFMDALLMRGFDFPLLSPQHLMNCGGNAGQCRGDYGSRVSQRLVNLRSLHTNANYPYTARSASCTQNSRSGQRYGTIESYKTIDGSVRSILAALHNRQPVSVGVAAGGAWSAYRGGRFNGCGSMATNHYVTIVGVDCESSVDSEGYCVFNSQGNLPAGVGTFTLRNSWGTRWGENGWMRTTITNSRGARCNNIAGGRGNSQILEIGIDWKPKEPVVLSMENKSMELEITVQPEFDASKVENTFKSLLKFVGE